MREFLQKMIFQADVRSTEFMDLRYQDRFSTTIVLRDGVLETAKTAIETGISARAFVNGQWGHAYSRVINETDISQTITLALKSARLLGKNHAERKITIATPQIAHSEGVMEINPKEIAIDDKIVNLREMVQNASLSDQIVSSSFTYSDSLTHEIVANSEGTDTSTITPHINLSTSLIASDGKKALNCSFSEGKSVGYEFFEKIDASNEFLLKLNNQATQMLASKKLTKRTFDVVLDPSIVGLITHEAIGSSLDLKRTPQLIAALNSKIASEEITLIDDPTIPNAFGSYEYDSEGTKSEKKYLIKNGVLNTLLYDLDATSNYDVSSNGASRAFLPFDKTNAGLSNTFIAPKDASFDELLSECKNGLYLKGASGGFAFANGSFVFQAEQGIRINNGELIEEESYYFPEITGWNHEFLNNVQMVGKELRIGNGSFCDKNGIRPVETGGPAMLIKQLYIGGD